MAGMVQPAGISSIAAEGWACRNGTPVEAPLAEAGCEREM